MDNLNIEQKELQNKLKEFIASKDNGFFGVMGAGGTGKTYTICKTINPKEAVFLGATNKVCQVLKNGLASNGYVGMKIKTIDSFLSFKIKKDHFNRSVITHRLPKLEDIPKIIVIDEISLINNRSLEMLLKLKHKRKFILLGDDMQIPPIEDDFVRNNEGFKISKVFTELDYSFTITTQQRQKDGTPLFNFIANFRQHMTKRMDLQRLAHKHSNGNDIQYFQINDPEFKSLIKKSENIAVCYKNLSVLGLSWLIGSTKVNQSHYRVNDINVGDKVFFDSYYNDDKNSFYTSEAVTIQEIEENSSIEVEVKKDLIITVPIKRLMITNKDSQNFIINTGYGYKETLYPVYYQVNKWREKYQKEIERYNSLGHRISVFKTQKLIADLNTVYSDFQLSLAKLKKPFAITAHKAQGSTYDSVIVPVYDYWAKMPQDSNQLLYVAMSRAKERLIFVNKLDNFKDNSNRYGFTEYEKFSIASANNYECNICKNNLEDREFDIDHIIPIAIGGKNTIDNLQPLCKSCHKEKSKTEQYEAAV